MDQVVETYTTPAEQATLSATALAQTAAFRAARPEMMDPMPEEGDMPEPVVADGTMQFVAPDGRTKEVPGQIELRGAMRFVTVAPAEEGEATSWSGLLCPFGVPTSDLRILDPAEPGAIGWRALPLVLMAQFETQPGHDGAKISGRIISIHEDTQTINGETITGLFAEGVFDDAMDGSDVGREAARLCRDGTLTGVSVDLAVEEMELRTNDNEPIPEDDDDAFWDAMFGDGLMAVTRGELMGATMTPFPAFAEAEIELVASARHFAALMASARPNPGPVPGAGTEGDDSPARHARAVGGRLVASTVTSPVLTVGATEITHDQAQALAALTAAGFASRNEIRTGWLGLDSVPGLDGLELTPGELRAASIVLEAQEGKQSGALAASLESVARSLEDRKQTSEEVSEAVASVRAAQSALTAAVERAEAAAARPARRLRVVRDTDGRAVTYEEEYGNGAGG